MPRVELSHVVAIVTTWEVDIARVRPYPNNPFTGGRIPLYDVPTYLMEVYPATDRFEPKGSACKSFEVIRFGVNNNNDRRVPRVIGLKDAQSYTLGWQSYMGGSWHLYGDFLIHDGPDDPLETDRGWGANGCIEVCIAGDWERFNKAVIDYAYDDPEVKRPPLPQAEIARQKVFQIKLRAVDGYPPLKESPNRTWLRRRRGD